MKNKSIKKIDFSRKRFATIADRYYNEGKYVSALRLAYKELNEYEGDADVYARLADIYEAMGLHGSAINWLFRFLDIAAPEDYPDIYEGLAVNFLNMGNEAASAYYYNLLVDVDDTLPQETKFDIAQTFAKPKSANFRFVYPPQLADYSKELSAGSRALKAGDTRRAIEFLSVIEKGSKEYAEAQEMQAVAQLLAGNVEKAREICETQLQDTPDDLRVLATLAAVYLEQGEDEKAREIAERLCQMPQDNTDDMYKVATVCCENGLHEEAYEKFTELERKLPFDGRMLYFKAVAAFKCGKYTESERAFDELCSVYPDAEVAKYYLKSLRAYNNEEKSNANAVLPVEPSYFYHLPQEEREARCRILLQIRETPKEEAQLLGLLAWHDGYLRWCFDEMDGADHDLQYLAILTGEYVRADDFLREVLLDDEVLDVLKVETLRLLYERNEEMDVGVVLYHVFHHVDILKLSIGRKRRKYFIQAHAKTASKFVMVSANHGLKLKRATEELYRSLEANNNLELVTNPDDCACAIYILSGLTELRGDMQKMISAFEANAENVEKILSGALGKTTQSPANTEEKENDAR